MVDGKICNVMSETRSTQTCYICGATPRKMNTITDMQIPDTAMYEFGISSLHAWIRAFECMLHISYKVGIKKWQTRNADEKLKIEERKREVQAAFKAQLGLIVDMPKPGAGNTNDGNMARKFFNNPDTSSAITGINKELIYRFQIILRTLSCGYEIAIDKFAQYAEQTRNLYLKHYSWYYMPVTIHKILIHGSAIIKSCIIPIGQMSEEAQEARNKDIRKIREGHTRKISRESTNKDMLSHLLVSSDPLITSLTKQVPKKSTTISGDVLELLASPKL